MDAACVAEVVCFCMIQIQTALVADVASCVLKCGYAVYWQFLSVVWSFVSNAISELSVCQ